MTLLVLPLSTVPDFVPKTLSQATRYQHQSSLDLFFSWPLCCWILLFMHHIKLLHCRLCGLVLDFVDLSCWQSCLAVNVTSTPTVDPLTSAADVDCSGIKFAPHQGPLL